MQEDRHLTFPIAKVRQDAKKFTKLVTRRPKDNKDARCDPVIPPPFSSSTYVHTLLMSVSAVSKSILMHDEGGWTSNETGSGALLVS